MYYLCAIINEILIHGRMKFKELIKIIEADGWYALKRTGSSHRQYKHPNKKGRVTIAGELSDDAAPKTRDSILRQAGLK
jgi:predicted RNA binding protein YcfA (HicA-like mRNA interferase family)